MTDYEKMIDAGLFADSERVELLYGFLVRKMARHPPHDGSIQLVVAALTAVLPSGWCVRVQSSLRLGHSVPEPDIAVAQGGPRSYLTCHPGPADVALVVEVADSSVPIDRGDKIPLYAEAGVAEYWIVNIPDGQVEVYSRPSGPSTAPEYAERRTYRPGDAVPLPAPLGGATIPAADLLP